MNSVVSVVRYIRLMKPGIIMGNTITMVGGFFLAKQGEFNLFVFLGTFFGLIFLIGSACVLNCCIDADIDAKMDRTKDRPIPNGDIGRSQALMFGIVLAWISFGYFAFFSNVVCLITAFVGFFVYVFLYSFWKSKSPYATLLGSISGAVPPVIGYTAISAQMDVSAMILFAMLFFWQVPHFYAIAIFRMREYKAASIPVFPLVYGLEKTKYQILYYTALFACMCPLLFIYGVATLPFFIVSSILSLVWLGIALKIYKSKVDVETWARQMFICSLVVITGVSLSMIVT